MKKRGRPVNISPVSNEEAPSPAPAPAPVIDDFGKYYKSGSFTDATVVCKGRPWKVHKILLAKKSDYFDMAFESSFREAHDGQTDLRDDDESAVAALIYYFYHNDYDVKISNSTGLQTPVFHLKVFALGDKDLVKGLCGLAEKKFGASMSLSWESHEFADIVKEIYDSTTGDKDGQPNQFRQAVLDIASAHADKLFSRASKYSKFRDVAWSTPEFSAELMRMKSCDTEVQSSPEMFIDEAMVGPRRRSTRFTAPTFKCPRCCGRFSGNFSATSWARYTHQCSPFARQNVHATNAMTERAWMLYQVP